MNFDLGVSNATLWVESGAMNCGAWSHIAANSILKIPWIQEVQTVFYSERVFNLNLENGFSLEVHRSLVGKGDVLCKRPTTRFAIIRLGHHARRRRFELEQVNRVKMDKRLRIRGPEPNQHARFRAQTLLAKSFARIHYMPLN